MTVRYRFSLLVIVLSSGCALARAPITDFDGGSPLPDVPGLDAPRPDVPGLDAPIADVPIPIDLDVPAPPPDTAGCEDTDITCNRIDEDCNGIVDDTGACSIGATCAGFTIGGVAYQSCPAITGMDAWGGACRRMGPGYDLAVFANGTQQDQVRDRLAALAIAEPHWVGLNDFEREGMLVWRDRTSTLVPMLSSSVDDPTKHCAVFRNTGFYELLGCAESQRVLCAAPLTNPPCGGGDEGTDCNGIDENCDGRVDEGLVCGRDCTASTFWDHVYYRCRDARTSAQAPMECDTRMGGARLVTIDGETERLAVLASLDANAWIGLTQARDAATTVAGWRWPDTAVTFGSPAMQGVSPWGGGEPNDSNNSENNDENCAIIRTGDGLFDDRRCGDSEDFICERTWSY